MNKKRKSHSTIANNQNRKNAFLLTLLYNLLITSKVAV